MFGLGLATSGDWFIQVLLLIVWRLGGLGFFVILKTDDENLRQKRTLPPVAYRALFSQKQFLLYLIPWLMFSLITFLTIPIQASMVGQSEVDLMTIIESALGGVFSLLGGFLADRVGRKRIAIVGFVMLGLGYSVLGISAELTSWYFYTVVDGIAWGLLYVLFVITIWGDLSNNSSAEKYYAIGVAPFFASKFLQLTMSNNISAAIMPAAIFSFTAFFLFVAVLPLIYAPETLPEKVLQDRDLKSYVEKAKKKAAKESQTVSKPEEQKEAPPADSDEDAEYEEACKLAEKYY
jgi:MFS family permease